MSGDPTSVKCPECGDDFDPSAMGGWCTNSECNEFRWKSDEPSAADSDGTVEVASGVGEESTDEGASGDSHGAVEESGSAAAAGEPEAAGGAAAVEPVTDEAGQDEVACPNCGKSVPDQNFCKECGAELGGEGPEQEADPETGAEGTAEVDADGGAEVEAGGAAEAAPELSLDACPNCGKDVDDAWLACPFCQEDLEQHRQPAASVSANAEVSESAEASADEGPKSEADDTPPERVVVSVGNDELEVSDGGSIGSEVRAAHVDAGGDADEAQWISREHVRFERVGDEFYIIHKGTNETSLNGKTLDDDERRRISDGDTIEFAGVTTGTVRLE